MFKLAYKQCSCFIKGWFHCLTSESKGRFLVKNVLMFGSAWCLFMAQIQFSLIKKIKIGRPEHLQMPHPLYLITSHFCLTPTFSQSGRHMWITTPYFRKHKLIAIDLSKHQARDADPIALQQINFTVDLSGSNNRLIFFIIEEGKETILNFSQGTVKAIIILFCFNIISI